jgi:hypothetical protein
MHQSKGTHDREAFVVVCHAPTTTEAPVIRGLLQSAGIASPADSFTDPFPTREPPEGMSGTEVLALESQADDARRIIESYQKKPSQSDAQ